MATGDTNTKNKIINLANVEFTENGLYVPNKGVTGFGKVKVSVPPDARKKPLYVTPTSTDNITSITWDEYTGPYMDTYAKSIGYKKENRSVYDFNNNFIGRASIDGVITDSAEKIIGKVSPFNAVYNVEEDKIIGYSDQKNYAYDLEDNEIGLVKPDKTVVDFEEVVIGKVHSSEYLAYNNLETEYVGVRDIKVRRVSSWIDSEISADNILKGHKILGVAGNVIELHGEERTANSSTSTQVITPSSGKNGITKLTINPYTLQQKSVTPQFSTQYVYPSSGYNGLSRVDVNPINVSIIVEEEPNLKPENIKKNVRLFDGQIVGTYDNYPPLTTLSVSPTTSLQVKTPESPYHGFTEVSIDPVTRYIDSNIQPENIRRDVTILGVTGTFVVDKLQAKTVDPQPYQQIVTYDSSEADGLSSVTVNAVTSSVDENIQAGNIKKDVTILGVTGDYDPQPIIQPTVTVTPTTLNQSVTPDSGYDGLGRVDINAVTSSIDPNILAENIKKNINILGVTGTYDPKPNYQAEKIVQPVTSGDVEVSADPTYDALLKVIVKAVTASIDPNILPKNIRKNISILGVLGTMEEGGGQKWFDFSGIQNFVELNQDAYSEGGNESIQMICSTNNFELENLINDTFPSISNINAIMFTQVYGYDDEEVTDDILKQCYINFIGGSLYQDYSHITSISDQIRYFYPFINNYNVDGLTIGLDYDDGSARTMKLYVLTDSTKRYSPVPVLVNGDMNPGLLPSDYDGFRYVKEITIPAHNVFSPKLVDKSNVQWVLRDRYGLTHTLETKLNEPLNVNVSALDKDYGQADNETDIFVGYKLKEFSGVTLDKNTGVATQSVSGVTGYITIPGSLEKQSGYYYYFKFSPSSYSGNSTYYTIAWCSSLFALYIFRNGTGNQYYPAWLYQWNSATTGNLTWNSSYPMYTGNIYYFRVYINGTTSTISWSSNGSSWTQLTSFSSSYINPTNSNAISIYASEGPNTKLYADGCYVTNSSGNVMYSTLEETYAKKTSHEIVDLTRSLYVADYSIGGNTINFLDDGSETDINLYVADVTETLQDVTIDYNYGSLEEQPVNIDTFVDGYNFRYDSATNAISNGSKSYYVSSGISTGYFIIDPAPISRTFSVTCYTSSESGYDFGGIYIGNTYMEMTRSNYQNNTSLSDGSWLYRNTQSSATYTKTLDANKKYYIEFIYTKDGGGESGLDKFVISKITFKAYVKNPYTYLMSLDDSFKQVYPQFSNYIYAERIHLPEHNIYTKEDGEWKGLKQLTFNVTGEDEFYTDIIEG